MISDDIGLSVLDLSKVLMYNFHYGVMKPFFGDELKVLYTDTDSFIYQTRNKNIYEFMKNNLEYFDTSNYPRDHPCYSTENEKVIGKFKDELGGEKMTKFVGLRSKMYAYQVENGEVSKRCKGIKQCVVKKNITFEDYEKCLKEQVELFREQNVIRSYKHQLFTETVKKKPSVGKMIRDTCCLIRKKPSLTAITL